MFYNHDYVENLKKRYPRGTRIELDMMSDDPPPDSARHKRYSGSRG